MFQSGQCSVKAISEQAPPERTLLLLSAILQWSTFFIDILLTYFTFRWFLALRNAFMEIEGVY